MRILFTDEIPFDVVKTFVDEGHNVHIYGGGSLFNKTRPAFRLAKKSGVNHYFVHWGELKHIRENNSIDMFITTDDKYSNVYGFNKFIKEEKHDFADGVETVRTIEERWVTQPESTKGGESCPICLTLQNMGWVERSAPVTYTWSSGSKTINGLPGYRLAHSTIGEGNWKVGDNVCKCYKEFRNGFKTINLSKEPRIVHINGCCNH